MCCFTNQKFSMIQEVSQEEQRLHRNFVFRHIDTLTDVLAAEEFQQQRMSPCGCPRATPATVAHGREKNKDPWDCVYQRIETLDREDESRRPNCLCGDPLAGSDDPLDTVAAAVLADRDGVTERYFDHQERTLVASLREEVGEWEEIFELGLEDLDEICESLGPEYGIRKERLDRLFRALETISDHRYTDSLTLRDLPCVAYDYLEEMFADLPGISEQEAWWLVLVALDKPVWPASSEIDQLLIDIGLLSTEEVLGESGHHEVLEERLTPRQILPLHRELAAHSRFCGTDHTTASCEIRRFTLSYRARKQECDRDVPTIIDLFAGAGGLSCGFRDAGCEIGFATDQDQHAMDTYRLNHPEILHRQIQCCDINELLEDQQLAEYLPQDVDILVGGPPCQALSVAGYRARLADDDDYSVLEDPRTELYRQYVDVLEEARPTFLVMENVEGILNEIEDTGRKVIDDVREALEKAGYSSEARLLDCSQFGIPQERDRVFIIGARQDSFPDPDQLIQDLFDELEGSRDSSTPSIRQALSNLPRLRRGEGGKVVAGREPGRASEYIQTHNIGDETSLTYNHRAREHPMEKDRTLFDDVMVPGDTGWDVKYRKGRDDLIEYNVGTEENPEFKDKYRMLYWDRASPTIVAHLQKDSNSFILPDYYQYVQNDPERADDRRNRGLTPREAARLQSFPDSYFFLGPFTSQFRQIGNAVPPVAGKVIASILVENLPETAEKPALEGEDAASRAAMTDD